MDYGEKHNLRYVYIFFSEDVNESVQQPELGDIFNALLLRRATLVPFGNKEEHVSV